MSRCKNQLDFRHDTYTERNIANNHNRLLKKYWWEADQLAIYWLYREAAPPEWSERDLNPWPPYFKSRTLTNPAVKLLYWFHRRLSLPFKLIRHANGACRKRFWTGRTSVLVWIENIFKRSFSKTVKLQWNHVISLPEFFLKHKSKMTSDCCIFKFLRKTFDAFSERILRAKFLRRRADEFWSALQTPRIITQWWTLIHELLFFYFIWWTMNIEQ